MINYKHQKCSKKFSTRYKNLEDLFIFHNETFNIWSHLCGSILFGYLGYITLFSFTGYFPSVYCFTVCFALAASTYYHLCCSKMNIYKNKEILKNIKLLSKYKNFILVIINNEMNKNKKDETDPTLRYYGLGAQILKDFNIKNMILLSRTKKKINWT